MYTPFSFSAGTTLIEDNKGWQDSDSFKFWVPATAVQISKSEQGKPNQKRWIQGIASTDSTDLQGEVVVQNGIDFSYFLKHGYFNNDHKQGFEHKIGQPTECRVTKKGLWVKGFLFNDKKIADDVWEMMNSLEKTPGANRRVGFSIEGKVKRRDGSRIESCWIQDIAITPAPVNSTTWAEMAKSLSAQPWLTDVVTGTPDTVIKSVTLSETASYIEETTGVAPEDALVIAETIFAGLSGKGAS